MTGALDDRPDPRTSGTGAPPPHSLAVRTHGVRLPAPRQAHPGVPTGDTVVGIKECPLGAACTARCLRAGRRTPRLGHRRKATRERPAMTAIGEVTLEGIVKDYGAFRALKAIDLRIAPGEFFALLGPSGSGKSTTLRVIAGLEVPDAGRMLVDGADMTFAPPGERNVAMVFQNYALYPHMTLEQNIGFPLRMDRVPKAEIAARVREAAGKVRIDHLLARRPGQLSGGQQQRVALARAIVRQPRLFLLDEPLSNLDAQLRLETRIELKRLHGSLDVTTIYVTHDQEEAMTIADRMAVFREGEIMQTGTPEAVFGQPDSIDVAAFIGSPPMNLIPARIEDGAAVFPGWRLPLAGAPARGEVIVGVRPGRIRLADADTSEGLAGRLVLSENLGEAMLLNVEVEGALVKLRLPEVRRIAEGSPVRLVFDPTPSFSSIQRPAAASTGGPTGGKPDESRLPAVRFREPADAAALWRPVARHAQLQAPRRAHRHLRQPLYRLDALHARAPRHADRPPLLPAPELGPAGALRQFLPGDPEDRRLLLAPHLRPLPLLGGRRRDAITPATTPSSSSVARNPTPGKCCSTRRSTASARSTTRARTTSAPGRTPTTT